MVKSFVEVHRKFKYDGISYNTKQLRTKALDLIKQGHDFEKKTGQFLIDWLNKEDYIIAETSGSTGNPKRIKLQKSAMVNSAIATGHFFNLKSGDKALNCLSSDYIAGKMMLVRAIVLGLEIQMFVTDQMQVHNGNREAFIDFIVFGVFNKKINHENYYYLFSIIIIIFSIIFVSRRGI